VHLEETDRPVKPSGFNLFINVKSYLTSSFSLVLYPEIRKVEPFIDYHTLRPVMLIFRFSKSGNKAFKRNFSLTGKVF